MGRNIQYQFLNAINESFDNGGRDKHSDKHNGKSLETIYSYGERTNLMDLAAQVSKFIKENYPDVKKVLDIKGEIIQDFLNTKAATCNKESLGQYASRIHKLEHVVNKIYKGTVTWHSDLITPVANNGTDKTRDIAMTRKDYNSILNRAYGMDSKSMSVVAIELSGRFALRVSEACKLQPRDIDFKKMRLHVHESKGGRSRDIDIRPNDIEFLKKITDGKQSDKRIVAIREDSVNKYLARSQEALNIRSRYRDAKTGVHSIRKMVAQELYDKHRKNGLSKKESINKVSEYLGHGKNRAETMKQYILNIH